MSPSGKLWAWLIGAAFIAVFVAVDHAGALRPWYGFHHITPWNPVVGLSFSLIYFFGASYWPVVVLAHVAGYLFVQQTMGVEIVGLGGALVGSLPYIAAGTLYKRINSGAPFGDLNSMLMFVALGVVAAASAGTLHGLALWLADLINTQSIVTAASRRFVGDLSGLLGVGAFCLLAGKSSTLFIGKPVTTGFQLLAIIAMLFVVFGYPFAPALQLFYLLFLPLLWVALVHGLHGAVIALVIIQLGIVIATSLPLGELTSLTAIQTLTITLTITGLMVGMVVTEWRSAARRQRDQQAALERALRLRSVGEVAAVIGHEINQPLTVISTYSKLMRDAMDGGDQARARELLEKVIAQSTRAASVMRSFRALLRRGEVNRNDVCIRTLARDIREIVAEDCRNKGITFDISVPPEFPDVSADRVQLQQALLNLVRNSIDAIGSHAKRGEIALTAELDPLGRAEITVSDDGPGFQTGVGEVATTPFLSTKVDGTGLGLAVARTVAEAHGGSLAVLETRKGAAVRLRLPVKGSELS